MELINISAFWLTAVVLVITSLLAVFLPKISYSIFFGFLTFIFFGLLYFLLNAPFNAIAQISIYGVTFSVLFVFAIMLTNTPKDDKKYLFISKRLFLTLLGVFLIIFSLLGIIRQDMNFGLSEFLNPQGYLIADSSTSLQILGNSLFTKYLFSFELLSVLLLIGVVGVFIFVNKNPKVQEDLKSE